MWHKSAPLYRHVVAHVKFPILIITHALVIVMFWYDWTCSITCRRVSAVESNSKRNGPQEKLVCVLAMCVYVLAHNSVKSFACTIYILFFPSILSVTPPTPPSPTLPGLPSPPPGSGTACLRRGQSVLGSVTVCTFVTRVNWIQELMSAAKERPTPTHSPTLYRI